MIPERVFDHQACAHSARYEKHLLAGLIFTADTGEKLIQIVENFHRNLPEFLPEIFDRTT
jgi:hypothetical protein